MKSLILSMDQSKISGIVSSLSCKQSVCLLSLFILYAVFPLSSMAIPPRKLLSEQGSTGTVICVGARCDPPYPILNCTGYFGFNISAPPEPIGETKDSQSHVVPYLITMVCVLGVSFLMLTTCTILLRNRWTRRRNSIRVAAGTREDFFDREDHGPIDNPIWHIVTAGLQQSVIDSITAFKYKKYEGLIEGSDCSVCLTEFEDGDDLRILPKCSHAFHLPCIDTWLRSHTNCPLCRAPVVNDSISGGSDAIEMDQTVNLENGVGGSSQRHQAGEGQSSDGAGGRAGELVILPVEGVRIAEILKKNRELRILSDLGARPWAMEKEFQPMRRSFSLDASLASAISEAIPSASSVKFGESSQQEKKVNPSEKTIKQGCGNSSVSGLMKSSSIGRSLQKAPVSMKRSFSSSGKFLSSFRHGRSQTLILPLFERSHHSLNSG